MAPLQRLKLMRFWLFLLVWQLNLLLPRLLLVRQRIRGNASDGGAYANGRTGAFGARRLCHEPTNALEAAGTSRRKGNTGAEAG